MSELYDSINTRFSIHFEGKNNSVQDSYGDSAMTISSSLHLISLFILLNYIVLIPRWKSYGSDEDTTNLQRESRGGARSVKGAQKSVISSRKGDNGRGDHFPASHSTTTARSKKKNRLQSNVTGAETAAGGVNGFGPSDTRASSSSRRMVSKTNQKNKSTTKTSSTAASRKIHIKGRPSKLVKSVRLSPGNTTRHLGSGRSDAVGSGPSRNNNKRIDSKRRSAAVTMQQNRARTSGKPASGRRRTTPVAPPSPSASTSPKSVRNSSRSKRSFFNDIQRSNARGVGGRGHSSSSTTAGIAAETAYPIANAKESHRKVKADLLANIVQGGEKYSEGDAVGAAGTVSSAKEGSARDVDRDRISLTTGNRRVSSGGGAAAVVAATIPKNEKKTNPSPGDDSDRGTSSHNEMNSLLQYLDNVAMNTKTQDVMLESINGSVAASSSSQLLRKPLSTKATRAPKAPSASIARVSASARMMYAIGSGLVRDVFGGIKAKMDRLKNSLQREKEGSAKLKETLESKEKQFQDSRKQEFEAVLERQHALSDRLLKDKEALGKQCAAFAEKAKEAEAGFKKTTEVLREKHKALLVNKQKQWAAAEKARRDKWERERTAKIKEITIRGLEPQIQGILKKGKEDLKRAEERHQAVQEAQRKEHLTMLEQAKLAATEDGKRQGREEARRKSEEVERRAKDIEATGMMRVLEERSKMDREFAEEKSRLQQAVIAERQKSAEAILQKAEEFRVQFAEERARQAREVEVLRTKQESDRERDRERLRIEKEQWQKAVLVRLNKQAKLREKALVEELRKEQQKELEART
eukprot:jgi/Bigna1/72118/fgenesh1_pg.18_\